MSFTNTVLITGGTAGLGYQATLIIARQRPEYLVVVASRTDKTSAAKSINETLKQKNVIFLPLDLASPAKVRAFVQDWETKNFPPIIALVLNAGLQFPAELRHTSDGMESTFAVNHFGHALLFHLLFPRLAKGARIVVTSSGTHDPAQKSGMPDAEYTTAEDLAHPDPKTASKDGRQRYSSSKLVNVMWAYALHRRLERLPEKGLTVTVMDPGLMPGTGLAREYSPMARFVWKQIMTRTSPILRVVVHPNVRTPRESGRNLARLAVGDDVKGISGVYYEGHRQIKSSTVSYDEEKQEELWQWTVKNAAKDEEEAAKFNIGA